MSRVHWCDCWSKTKLETFPTILDDMPVDASALFAQIYAQHRATTYKDKDSTAINEDRPASYRRGLAKLLADVTGESVTVGERDVILSAPAARALGVGWNAVSQ